MQTLSRPIALVLSVGGAATAILAVSAVTAPAMADSDVQESVTGHVDFVNPNSGNTVIYSLVAVRHANGTVSGEFEEEVYNAAGEFVRRTHGVHICLTITGNIARTGGVVTQSENSVPVGTCEFSGVTSGS